jgi:hypothetical protein
MSATVRSAARPRPAIGGAILGDQPLLDLPTSTVAHPGQYLLFVALGW